jgi:hypothetical protein
MNAFRVPPEDFYQLEFPKKRFLHTAGKDAFLSQSVGAPDASLHKKVVRRLICINRVCKTDGKFWRR